LKKTVLMLTVVSNGTVGKLVYLNLIVSEPKKKT